MVSHATLLRGLSFDALVRAPSIVQRTDQDFVAAMLAELRGGGRQSALANSRASERDGAALKLFQPIHRTFHIALCELVCDTFGEPRLDPRKIESAGLVIRRIAVDDARGEPLRPERLEAWSGNDDQGFKWNALNGSSAEQLDPDAPRRAQLLRSLPDAVAGTRLTNFERTPVSERTSPLFVAPPDACAAARRTVLFGVLPLASSEVEAKRLADQLGPAQRAQIEGHLSPYLRVSGAPKSLPFAGSTITRGFAKNDALADFLTLLKQLRIEMGALGATPNALDSLLARIQLPVRAGDALIATPANVVLTKAADVLVNATDESFTMPDAWPALDANTAGAILDAVESVLNERLKTLVPPRARYADPDALYRLRAFARIRRDDGCSPELVWSDYSEPFKIAPWYENGVLPAVHVDLPAITRDNIAKFKPNVAFSVPKDVFNLMQGLDAEKLLKGEPSPSGNLALNWICSFNIPVITLCAFIVLSIFLQLLNIVFWWLPFIRICIPFPFKRR